jgi:hypothetical protein
VKKVHDYTHHYRGYWSEGGVCRIRIYQSECQPPVVICSQLPENINTSVTNMAEYIAAEVIEHYDLPTPLTWIEHYPEHKGETGEWTLVSFASWKIGEASLGGVARRRIGSPNWSNLSSALVQDLLGGFRHTVQYGSRV